MFRVFIVGIAALSIGGCKCKDDSVVLTDQCKTVNGVQADRPNACSSSSECGDHFACRAPDKANPTLQCCMLVERPCTTEADCCAGQLCTNDSPPVCIDKFIECENDAACGPGQKCESFTTAFNTSNRCRYAACDSLGQCGDGLSCFQGECIPGLPCGGACPSGKACVTTTNLCQDYKSPTNRESAACPMTCNAGFIATFENNRDIWDTCELSKVKCVCAELPSLASEDMGRYSAVAADTNAVFASMYDGQYGDLVVTRFDLNGAKLDSTWVDGVPAGTATWGPNGARKGITTPGPDVGRYTDIAVRSGVTYVSYYDVTNKDLKLAVRNGAGTWSSHTVDSAGDVGMFTSVAIDPSGRPAISYFQSGADSSFNAASCPAPAPTSAVSLITALKYAHAKTASPTSAADWDVKVIACASKPAPLCEACLTGSASSCADPGSGGTTACYANATGCTGCDPTADVCVTVGAAAKCAKKVTPLALLDIPVGTGLFSSLEFDQQEAVIAYQQRVLVNDRPDGDLYAVRVSALNVAAAPVLISSTGDTGYFPDVKVNTSTRAVSIAFHDMTSKTFKYYQAATLQPNVTLETIDPGVDAQHVGELGAVGTDSAVVLGGPAGAIYTVYQDATRGDLKLAKRTTAWAPETIRSNGAVGFFADGVLVDGNIYATHCQLHTKKVDGVVHLNNSLILEKIPAN